MQFLYRWYGQHQSMWVVQLKNVLMQNPDGHNLSIYTSVNTVHRNSCYYFAFALLGTFYDTFYCSGNYQGVRPYIRGPSCNQCPAGTTCEGTLCVSKQSQTATTKGPIKTTTRGKTTTTPRGPTTTTTTVKYPPPSETGRILQPDSYQKATIINFLDRYRSAVNPPASNMMKVVCILTYICDKIYYSL